MNPIGQEVRIYNGLIAPGPVNLDFNIASLPAGTYFVRLDLEDSFAIQPIVKQ